ncbi:histidine triad nucleotide-binding protein [bacterium]|nr:histidine triad nucleotide-binding protein [bacterium]
MPDCLFCKIAAGAIPAERVYENDDVLVFPDIHPVARVHVLVIPKRHFATTIDMAEDAPELFGAMMKAANEVARKKGIDRSGFRVIFNTNADGGQEIFHVHMHLLGGEPIGALRAR